MVVGAGVAGGGKGGEGEESLNSKYEVSVLQDERRFWRWLVRMVVKSVKVLNSTELCTGRLLRRGALGWPSQRVCDS